MVMRSKTAGTPPSHGAPRGFTLIEMLVVLSIVGLLLAISVPSTLSIANGLELSQTAATVAGKLQSARHHALASNHPVEVRFYQLSGDLPGGQSRLGALRTFAQEQDGTLRPLEALFWLPESVAATDDPVLSPMLDISNTGLHTGVEPQIPTGSGREDVEYIAFRFRPDGSTDLPDGSTQKYYFTLVQIQDLETSAAALSNFATIQVDPVNGNVRVLRPGG